VVQRSDARSFAPHDQADPVFGETLRAAARAGVEVLAWTCRVNLEGITIAEEIPADLG
jgi:sugar fermentation stimulation protein A